MRVLISRTDVFGALGMLTAWIFHLHRMQVVSYLTKFGRLLDGFVFRCGRLCAVRRPRLTQTARCLLCLELYFVIVRKPGGYFENVWSNKI